MKNSISIKIISQPVKNKSVIELYAVPTSNFRDAYLFGMPCKVVSKPYIKKRNIIGVGDVDEKVIDVISLFTGIEYTIDSKWCIFYLSAEDAIKNSRIKTECDQSVSTMIGKKYYPKDNAFIEDRDGNWESLVGKETVVCSLPYFDKTDTGDVRSFINVRYQGNLYRTLFEEWCFYKDDRSLYVYAV